MAIMQVYGTGICVVMSQQAWDKLSERVQEYDDMTFHIMGHQQENLWAKCFILVPCHDNSGMMVPFLCDMESVKILGLFLKDNEYFSIEHHKEIHVIDGECYEGPELQEYLAKIPAGWC